MGGHAERTTTIDSMVIASHPRGRMVEVSFAAEMNLSARHAVALVSALRDVVGNDSAPFGLLVDGARLRDVDADYRAVAATFFRQHSRAACLAFYNLRPVLRVLVEMFSLAVQVHAKAFPDEGAARAWLKVRGIEA